VSSPANRPRKPDYYFVLGLPPDATTAELHAAWRRQLKYWHPDRHNHPDALEHAKLINLAHDTLTDPVKRGAYDRQRSAQGWRPLDAREPPWTAAGARWARVDPNPPRRSADGYDRHGFASRLDEFLERGRILIEKPKDLASIAKWEAQTHSLLLDTLGSHTYVTRLERALSMPRPTNLILAYGVLWAAYEDALKGVLRPLKKPSK
jgi:curved DNA-binding protein CbpA